MARGKTASAPTRSKAKSSAKTSTSKAPTSKASTSTASRSTTARTAKTPTASTRRTGGTAGTGGPTYRELYAEAQRRDIKGRSSMDKAQLERVLSHKRGK